MRTFFMQVFCSLCAVGRAACFCITQRSNTALPSQSSTTIIPCFMQSNYLKSLENNTFEHGAGVDNISSDEDATNDPYEPGVAEAYGLIDTSGADGFDSASDSVGPGIYGGSVQRDADGNILIGMQYENHNHVPGPMYDGNGYSLMGRAIHKGPNKLKELLADYPQLIEEISTGGARPLHICGMSERGQHCAQILIDSGADIYSLDTYNYNALHRMASNNLDIGAEALVRAGLDPNSKDDGADSTPIEIAKRQRAIKFLMKMQKMGHYD